MMNAISRLKNRFVEGLNQYALDLLRISLGVVFLWFGLLKFAGISPADPMVYSSIPFLTETAG